MTDRLHLAGRHRAMVEALLRAHIPGVEVWAYGSRVNGRSHDGSDLDLALRNKALVPLPAAHPYALAEAFEESDLPFLVDAHDWTRLPSSFHTEIERDHVVLVAGSTGKGPGHGPTRCGR